MRTFYISIILLISALMVSCSSPEKPNGNGSKNVTSVENFKLKNFELSSRGGKLRIIVDNNSGYSLKPLDGVDKWINCRWGNFSGSGDGDTIVLLVSSNYLHDRTGRLRVVFHDPSRGCDTLTIIQKAAQPNLKRANIQGASALYVTNKRISASSEPYVSANILSRIMPDGWVEDVVFMDELGDNILVETEYIVNLSSELVYMRLNYGHLQSTDYVVRKSDGLMFAAPNDLYGNALITEKTNIQVDSDQNVYLNGRFKMSVHGNTLEIAALYIYSPYPIGSECIINSNDDILFYDEYNFICYNSFSGITNPIARSSFESYLYSSVFRIKSEPGNFYFLTTSQSNTGEITAQVYYTNLVRIKATYPNLSLDTICRIQTDKKDILFEFESLSILTCGQKTILQGRSKTNVGEDALTSFLVFTNENDYKIITDRQGSVLRTSNYVASDNYIYGLGNWGTTIFRLDPENGYKEIIWENDPNFNITDFSVSHDDVITFSAENSSDQTITLNQIRGSLYNIIKSDSRLDISRMDRIVRID